jgi:hypothetical protein
VLSYLGLILLFCIGKLNEPGAGPEQSGGETEKGTSWHSTSASAWQILFKLEATSPEHTKQWESLVNSIAKCPERASVETVYCVNTVSTQSDWKRTAFLRIAQSANTDSDLGSEVVQDRTSAPSKEGVDTV